MISELLILLIPVGIGLYVLASTVVIANKNYPPDRKPDSVVNRRLEPF